MAAGWPGILATVRFRVQTVEGRSHLPISVKKCREITSEIAR
jgi:hypothetical protein